MNKITQVDRLIHFYELEFNFNPLFRTVDERPFRELFAFIVKMAKDKHANRYLPLFDKIVFIHEIQVKPEEKMIYGKLLCIRKDVFPEIISTITDVSKGIEAAEDEGIVETTHFAVYDNGKDKPVVALEYNLYGCKINDFYGYIERVGVIYNAVINGRYMPIVRNQLESIADRIIRCSEFYVKIHKNNIAQIQSVDTGLYSALVASVDQYNSDYASLTLNFDYKNKPATPEVNNVIFNLIRAIGSDKSKINLFEKLQIIAEDADRNNKLQAFDLLVDKVKSRIKVEKKEKHRSIVSADLYPKMRSELIKQRLIQ